MPDFSNPNENLTERELKFSYWFVTHKILLKKILIVFLILLSAGLLSYGIYGFVDYYFLSGVTERRTLSTLPRDLVNLEVVKARAARPIEERGVTLIPAGERADAVASIYNPNNSWAAQFSYQFVILGENTAAKKGFILPGEEKFLLDLGIKTKTRSQSARLLISDIKWMRINPHKIPSYEAYAAERLRLAVSDVAFDSAFPLDSGTISRATFTVENQSAYGFWQAGFAVILYRGATVVGANYLTLNQFASGEKREASVTWFEPVSSPSKVEVRPEVNILDAAVYMPVR